MILGDSEYKEKIFSYIYDIVKYHECTILAISNVGSCARGTWKYGSDCDVSILYLRNTVKESKILHKELFNNNIEFTFCDIEQALEYLCSDQKGVYSIYYEIIEIITSQYTEDLFGVLHVIRDLVELRVPFKNISEAYLLHAKQLYNFNDGREKVNIKRYLTLVYLLLYVNWIIQMEQMPPLHIHILKSGCQDDAFKNLVELMIQRNNIWGQERKDKPYDHYAYKLIIPDEWEIHAVNRMFEYLENALLSKQWKGTPPKKIPVREIFEMLKVEKRILAKEILK